MKQNNLIANEYRIRNGSYRSDDSDGNNGAFMIPGPRGVSLYCIVSDNIWEHVSVSRHTLYTDRIPKVPFWDEMEYVKEFFWNDEEVAVQFHPRRSQYVNFHPGTLHIWRLVGMDFMTPPVIFV